MVLKVEREQKERRNSNNRKTKEKQSQTIAGASSQQLSAHFCIVGQRLTARQPHIELLDASGEITNSKIKVTATLQNSGDADGIAAIRHKTHCSDTTFETQRKEVLAPSPWNT